jgi:hypothetical protein
MTQSAPGGESEMKVYVVVFGWKYEGQSEDTLRVFARQEDAEAYRDLVECDHYLAHNPQNYRYDYALMLEREVIESSRRLEERPPRHFTQEDQVEH